MKEIEKVIADNINHLLKERKINKNDLAKIAGVSESTVGKWTLAKASPRMGAVQKISDYFNIPKSYILNEEKPIELPSNLYTYLPTAISAGLPFNVDGITNADKIDIPDSLMGKYAGNKSIVFSRICGDSMDKVISDGSLIAIKSVPLESLKNGDMVVFSTNYDYSVKYFYKTADKLIFKPASTNEAHHEQHYDLDANIQIHGKVVLYIVELD